MERFKRMIIFLILLNIVSLSASANSLRFPIDDIPNSDSPIAWRSLSQWYLISNTHSTLVEFDPLGGLRGKLASKWVLSDNRKVLTLTLRSDAKFSNGETVTSKDFKYSFQKYIATQGKSHPLKMAIVNGDKIVSAESDVNGIQTPNLSTIVIRLRYPFERIWSYLSFPSSGSVLPFGEKYENSSIRSGPYFIESIQDKKIILKRNKYYFSYSSLPNAPLNVELVSFDTFNEKVNAYLSNKIDIIPLLSPFDEIKTPPQNLGAVQQYPYHRVSLLILNSKKNKYKNRSVRKSVADTLSSTVLSEYKIPNIQWSNSFFPVFSVGHFELSKAKKQIGKKNLIKNANILVSEELYRDELLNVIRSRLEVVSNKTKFESISKHLLSKKIINRDFEMALFSIGFPMADVSHALSIYFIEEPHYLPGNYEKISSFLNKIHVSNLSIDLEQKEIWEKIGMEVLSSLEVIPIFHTGIRYVVNKRFESVENNLYRKDMDFSLFRKVSKK